MSVVENMKDVADLVKKFNDIELNRRILTLENEVLDLARANRRAQERIEELECALKLKRALRFGEPYYWQDVTRYPFAQSVGKKSTRPFM